MRHSGRNITSRDCPDMGEAVNFDSLRVLNHYNIHVYFPLFRTSADAKTPFKSKPQCHVFQQVWIEKYPRTRIVELTNDCNREVCSRKFHKSFRFERSLSSNHEDDGEKHRKNIKQKRNRFCAS